MSADVTKEQFQAVQDERTRRSNVICDDNGRRRKSTKFSSKRKDDAGMDLDLISKTVNRWNLPFSALKIQL